MKILICGASGLVGRTLIKIFREHNLDCVGTYNSNKMDTFIKLEFLNLKSLENKILEIKPDICISNIAERQTEICENNWSKIKKINIDIPYNLSLICNKNNIYFIHISTDYVYDGIKPPFNPNSNTNPLQNYGISKLVAEKRIISVFNSNNNYLILRVPVLYSNDFKNFKESAVTSIIKKILNKIETTTEDNFSIRRPLFIKDLAYFLINIFYNNLYGIHCFYNPYDKYTKYEIAILGSRILDTQINHIQPLNEKPSYGSILRPKDTQLLDNDIDFKKINITLLEDGLKQVLKNIIHPKINISEPLESCMLVFDLDGVLVDTEKVQWKSYRDALKIYNIDFTFDEYIKSSHSNNIKNYLFENYNFTNNEYNSMKTNKNKYIIDYKNEIKFIKGVELFINYINKFNLNHVVVTNGSRETVNLYKKVLPQLNLLKNWILREDYIYPKPDSESYELAIRKYYKGENYILGFENSLVGLRAIQKITKIIYFITYKEYIYLDEVKKDDCYLINDLNTIIYR